MLINGATGSGKSTLARMYVRDHPLALALDIDALRAMVGGWLDPEAGLIARRMALEVARLQLTEGRDVVVPQFLGRLAFLLELEALCTEVGAGFVEVALLSNPRDAAERFIRRSNDPETAAHRDAEALLQRAGGSGELGRMCDRLLDVVAKRPRTLTVTTVDGQAERAYRGLLAHLEAR